jgi:RNA polymerase sigma-70 factor (ECF subfamily)
MDDTLLARTARADAEAFAELYRRHVTRVYRYHAAHTGNIKDAEDLTSQTFMAALEGIASFRGEAPFAAWLMGIASRKRALFFRTRKPEVPLEAALHLPGSGPSTDQLAGRRLQIDSVTRALRGLSPDRAVELVYYVPAQRYITLSPGGSGETQPVYIQPAWRFYGRYSDGTIFEAIIQALDPLFLLPETEEPYLPG